MFLKERMGIVMINKFTGEYKFLSNMYPCIVEIEGQKYPSVEHAFQAMKSLDSNDRVAMSVCRSPEEAKQAGKLLNLRSDWEQVKVDLMYQILKEKFSNPELAQKLKSTEGEELIEGNTWGDNFWGVYKGQGENQLGKLLMKIREEI